MKLRLKNLATLNVDCTFHEERPFIALENVESWTGSLVQGVELPMRALPQAGMAVVEPGDILFGKLRPYLAKSWVVDRPALASTELMCLRPRTDTDSRWLGYLVLTSPFVEWAIATSEGTRMPRTSWEKVSEYRTSSLSLSEQRVIADYLDIETAQIDNLISKKHRLIGLLDEYDQSKIDDSFGNISRYEGVRLGYLAEVRTGMTLGGGDSLLASGITLPYLRVANVKEDRLDLNEVKTVVVDLATAKRTALCSGDVLMTEGGDIDKLGRGTVWRGEIDPCLHQNHVFAVRVRKQDILPEFLALVTRTSYARHYFEMTGVRSTNLASTSASKVADFKVPLPSAEDQHRLVQEYQHEWEALENTRKAISRQMTLLAERRQALITAAVTGETPMTEKEV